MASQPSIRPGRRQFDLWMLLEMTAAIAFALALLMGSNGQVTWTFDFGQLPADDIALKQWLEKQGHHDVRISRSDHSVILNSKRSLWEFVDPSFAHQLPQVPWQAIGYPFPHGMRGSSNWTMFSDSLYLWLVGFAILLGFSYFRRRRARMT